MTGQVATTEPIPLGEKGRFESLDVLRGFAVLGIFAINIWYFALPSVFFSNPTALGPLEGTDRIVWIVTYVFIAFKFITLFSGLFGAGITLMAERSSPGLHTRRMLILLASGLIHAYLIWPGDILFTYAVCGLLAVGMRRWSPVSLTITGAILVTIGFAITYLLIGSMSFMTPEQLAEQESMMWRPPMELIDEATLARQTGGFWEQVQINAGEAIFFQTFLLLMQSLWRTLGVMALGMAFMKWGILTGERSIRFYTIMAVLGFGLGMPLVGASVAHRIMTDWAMLPTMLTAESLNYWGSLPMAAGYMGLIMLLVKSGAFEAVRRVLAAAGRMAFTNYIMQSVITVTIMYGYGFGLFGTFSVSELGGIVLAVWGVQLLWSVLWLRAFQFGPLEWLWRSLTYGTFAPMRRQAV